MTLTLLKIWPKKSLAYFIISQIVQSPIHVVKNNSFCFSSENSWYLVLQRDGRRLFARMETYNLAPLERLLWEIYNRHEPSSTTSDLLAAQTSRLHDRFETSDAPALEKALGAATEFTRRMHYHHATHGEELLPGFTKQSSYSWGPISFVSGNRHSRNNGCINDSIIFLLAFGPACAKAPQRQLLPQRRIHITALPSAHCSQRFPGPWTVGWQSRSVGGVSHNTNRNGQNG